MSIWIGWADRAALVLIAPPRIEGGDFRLLHFETFHGLDFAKQAEKIKHYFDSYHITRITIDKTGMGTGVYQLVKQFFPQVLGLDYDLNLKNEMVLKMLNLVQKRRFKYDHGDKDVTASFMTIKRKTTTSGRQMTYVSDRSEDASHGDIAWAIMSTLVNEPFAGPSGLNQSLVMSF